MRAWLAALLCLFTLCFVTGCSKQEEESKAENQQAQNITLENYGLNIQVQSKHRLIITETLTVNYKDQISSISRVIPYEGYRFDPEKNEVIRYRMVLDQIESDTDCTVHKEAGKAYLTIGGASGTNSGGTQIYTLKYRLSCYQDEDSEQDLFFCNLLPYGWEYEITSANVNVTMPKDFETTGITMYRYSGGSWMGSDVSYTASGKTVSAYLKQEDILSNPDLSVQIKLPEGYFKGEKTLLPMQIFFYVLIVLMTAGILVFWWIFGKAGKGAKAELVKKHKLTSLEDAYLLRGTVTVTDVAAFLTGWAESGIVRIIQLSAKDYSITCLDKPDKGAKNFEFTLYDALCKDGIQTLTVGAAAARIRKVLPKLKRQVARNCAAICGGRLYTLESECVKFAALLFSVIPTLIVLAVGGHLVLDYSAGYVGLIVAGALLVIHAGMLVLKSSWKNIRKLFRLILAAICVIAEIMILGGLLYYGGSELNMAGQMIMAVIASLLMLAAALLSGRKSGGYQMQLAQLLAYKRYLKNPDLEGTDVSKIYYSQLPQAYVLRVGKMFSKKYDEYPLYAHDGLVLRGDSSKLSHSAGFYPSYQHFISTVFRAESEPVQSSVNKEGVQDTQNTSSGEKKEKLSGISGIFTLILSGVVSVFRKLAVWINEEIDWVEEKFDCLRWKFSHSSEEDESESEENEN